MRFSWGVHRHLLLFSVKTSKLSVGTIKCPQNFNGLYFSDKHDFSGIFCTNSKKITQLSLPRGYYGFIFQKCWNISILKFDDPKNGTIKCSLENGVWMKNGKHWGVLVLSIWWMVLSSAHAAWYLKSYSVHDIFRRINVKSGTIKCTLRT